MGLTDEKATIGNSQAEMKARHDAKSAATTALQLARDEAKKVKDIQDKLAMALAHRAEGRQQEALEAQRKLQTERNTLQELEKKKALVHASVQARVKMIADRLNAAKQAFQQAKSDAKKTLDAKLVNAKEQLKEKLRHISESES